MTAQDNNTQITDSLALLGRILLAWMFIPSGWGKIAGFNGLVGYIASQHVPLPEVAAVIAIFAELGLGLLLLVGWRARWAAFGLAVFVAVITPIFHAYWAVPEAQQMMQKLNFTKNFSIVGGLLVVAAFGAGRFSLDGRSRTEVPAGRPAYGGAR